MNRLEMREDFRAENPEIPERVIPDATLNSWAKKGNREICAFTRCIVTNVSETFNATVDLQHYDLEALIENFYDIDDLPGGGVYYDDEPLEKTTPAELNQKKRSWRTVDSGTPKFYFRRGKNLWFDRAPDDDLEIAVDCILVPDDFDSDTVTPYNDLSHLSPFHDGLLKYLQFRAKSKVGKEDEAQKAKKEYEDYLVWMKKQVSSAKHSSIQMRLTK